MPELPEVETLRLGLSKKIIGLKIKKVEILEKRSFFGDKKLIEGKQILSIWRRAKVLGVDLIDNKTYRQLDAQTINTSNGLKAQRSKGLITLLFHLKMSGQLILVRSDQEKGKRLIGGHPTLDMFGELPNKSTRVIFEFPDSSKLYFNDQRKFGWIKVVNSSELMANSLLKSLGPEPLEKSFTWQVLKTNLLRHKSQPVKVALLDQTVVSGIGNIYASECCFNANLDPRKKVSNLSDKEFKKLHQGIIKALKDGIRYGGSSKTHFFNEEGRRGYFLDHAYVYWREGEKCKICGSEIQKLQLAGRGTYYCPKCQK